MNDIILSTQNGEPVASSREVAKRFGKEHKHVLAAIRQILVAENSATKFFHETAFEYRGQRFPEYLMNRDGFALLAMGFTGKEAVTWKLKYIEAFNQMEKQLAAQHKDQQAVQDENIQRAIDQVIAARKRLDEQTAFLDKRREARDKSKALYLRVKALWDCPSVDCVVVLRPTKVRSLYSQMVGRGTRLSPGKKDLLLLDFLWMTDRHELCRPADLVCEDKAVARQMTENLAESGGPQDIEEAAVQASEDVVAQREEALAKQLEEQRRKKAKLVDPLQYEMSIQAEDLSGYVPAFGWEAGPPSAEQAAALEKLGILPEAVESAGKASLLLDRLHKRRDEGLTTPKQIRCLEKYGFQHVGTWSFEAARHMIDRIAAGGWRSAPKGVDPKTYTPSAEPIAADDMFIW